MPDIPVGTTVIPYGSPIMGIRSDKPGALSSSANTGATYLQTDSAGAMRINPEGGEQSFSGASTSVVLASSPTNVFVIGGSASGAVKIKRIAAMFEGTAAEVNLSLNKQYAPDSGGTTAAITLVVHDTGNIPFGAIPADLACGVYTANPTAGSSTGTVRVAKFPVAAAGTTGEVIVEWGFGNDGRQPIVLRGINQQLALNLNGTTISSGKMSVWIEGSIVANG